MTPTELATHPLREVVGQVSTLLAGPELTDPELRSSEPHAAAVDAIAALVSVVQRQLNDSAPQLVSGYGLSQLHAAFQNIFNELSAYASNKNQGHVLTARKQLEQGVFPHLWSFYPPALPADARGLRDAFDQISRTSTESVQWLIRQRDVLSQNIRSLEDRLTTADTALAELRERVVAQKAEATAALAQLQQQSAERETARLKEFEGETQALRAAFLQMQSASEQDQQAGLKSLALTQQKASQILQIVGNIGVTGNYQKVAEQESKQADEWRGMTVVFFFLGIALAVITLVQFWGQTFTPETAWSVLIRLAYALAITAPAYYTARESARHRTNADRARQTELELASLGPFIELMPEEKKNAIREELTKRYFGSSVPEHTVERPVDLNSAKDLLAEVAKLIKK